MHACRRRHPATTAAASISTPLQETIANASAKRQRMVRELCLSATNGDEPATQQPADAAQTRSCTPRIDGNTVDNTPRPAYISRDKLLADLREATAAKEKDKEYTQHHHSSRTQPQKRAHNRVVADAAMRGYDWEIRGLHAHVCPPAIPGGWWRPRGSGGGSVGGRGHTAGRAAAPGVVVATLLAGCRARRCAVAVGCCWHARVMCASVVIVYAIGSLGTPGPSGGVCPWWEGVWVCAW